MRIVVFGATGGVGQHVVRRAAERGHEVTAFVRTPEKLRYREGVTVRHADAFDASAVASAVEGQDAVISCLAPSTGLRKSDELERMAMNVVAGMRAAGVSRIAYCASLGVDDELEGIVGRGVQWVLRHPLADHRAALRHISEADLDLTVARPTMLNDGPPVDYAETFDRAPAMSHAIPRASVADFLVKAIEQPQRYSRTSVGLAPVRS